jgi:hypothetical protein
MATDNSFGSRRVQIQIQEGLAGNLEEPLLPQLDRRQSNFDASRVSLIDRRVNFMNLSISAPKKGEISLGVKADIDVGAAIGGDDMLPMLSLSKMNSRQHQPEESAMLGVGGAPGAGVLGQSYEAPKLTKGVSQMNVSKVAYIDRKSVIIDPG